MVVQTRGRRDQTVDYCSIRGDRNTAVEPMGTMDDGALRMPTLGTSGEMAWSVVEVVVNSQRR